MDSFKIVLTILLAIVASSATEDNTTNQTIQAVIKPQLVPNYPRHWGWHLIKKRIRKTKIPPDYLIPPRKWNYSVFNKQLIKEQQPQQQNLHPEQLPSQQQPQKQPQVVHIHHKLPPEQLPNQQQPQQQQVVHIHHNPPPEQFPILEKQPEDVEPSGSTNKLQFESNQPPKIEDNVFVDQVHEVSEPSVEELVLKVPQVQENPVLSVEESVLNLPQRQEIPVLSFEEHLLKLPQVQESVEEPVLKVPQVQLISEINAGTLSHLGMSSLSDKDADLLKLIAQIKSMSEEIPKKEPEKQKRQTQIGYKIPMPLAANIIGSAGVLKGHLGFGKSHQRLLNEPIPFFGTNQPSGVPEELATQIQLQSDSYGPAFNPNYKEEFPGFLPVKLGPNFQYIEFPIEMYKTKFDPVPVSDNVYVNHKLGIGQKAGHVFPVQGAKSVFGYTRSARFIGNLISH